MGLKRSAPGSARRGAPAATARVVAACLALSCTACAGALPRWESPDRVQRPPGPEYELREELRELPPPLILLDVELLEVPARGLEQVRSGPVEAVRLEELRVLPGARVVQQLSLPTRVDDPARVFLGEEHQGKRAGQSFELVARSDWTLTGELTLSEWRDHGRSEHVEVLTRASFADRWEEPLLIEVPGRRRVASGLGLVLDEPRVFLLHVSARRP